MQSLYESYLAPTLPQPVVAILDTLIAGAVQAQPYIGQLTALGTNLLKTLSGIGGGSAESTALMSTVIMIVTLYLSLRVFNYFRRMMMGWIIFAVKFVLFLVGAQIVFYINKYGWENAMRDASWWGSIIWGFVEEVLEGDKGGKKAPRGTRSRTGPERAGQYGYQGRDQVPVGGRARWI